MTPHKRKAALLWLVIFAAIIAGIFLLRTRHAPPQSVPAAKSSWAPTPYLGPEEWKNRELKDARITLSGPGPFLPCPVTAFNFSNEVQAGIARADFYYFMTGGLDVLAGRMQSRELRSIPPAPVLTPPGVKNAAGGRIRTGMCMAGARGGTFVDLRFQVEGQSIEGRSYVFAAPPEMWIVTIRHLESDVHAAEAAQRIADSIRIDGDPVVILESPGQSLTGDWREFLLVPGHLTAAAPQPWTKMESAALESDSRLPCRAAEERYFICQAASTVLIVGTGTCTEDQDALVDDALHRPPQSTPAPGDAPSPSPQVAILLGRRAISCESPFTVAKEERVRRKVVAVNGKRAWIFVANYPAHDAASLDLVNRVQASLKEE